MEVLLGVLVVGFILVQFPLALFVYVDAKRRAIENPELYALGIWVVPLAGIFVFAAYMSRRTELPRRDPPTVQEESVDSLHGTATTQWRVEIPGLRGLPTRLVYTVSGFGRYFWRGLVGIPLVVLFAGYVVDERLAVAYVGIAAAVWMVLLLSAMRFTEMSGEFDSAGETLCVVYEFGTHPLSRSPYEQEIAMDDVVSVELLPVGEHTLLRFEYENDMITSRPKSFLVHDRDVPAVRRAVQRTDILLREPNAERVTWQVWGRTGLAALVLLVIPAVLVTVEPGTAASTPVLFLGVAIGVWLVVGGIEYVSNRLPTR